MSSSDSCSKETSSDEPRGGDTLGRGEVGGAMGVKGRRRSRLEERNQPAVRKEKATTDELHHCLLLLLLLLRRKENNIKGEKGGEPVRPYGWSGPPGRAPGRRWISPGTS